MTNTVDSGTKTANRKFERDESSAQAEPVGAGKAVGLTGSPKDARRFRLPRPCKQGARDS